MKWYWVLLIAVSVTAILNIVFWLLYRRSNAWVYEVKEALKESSLTRAKEELAIEKKTKQTVLNELTLLTKDYKTILKWYEERKETLEDATKEKFDGLVSDPGVLDAKLDSLLGTEPGEGEAE